MSCDNALVETMYSSLDEESKKQLGLHHLDLSQVPDHFVQHSNTDAVIKELQQKILRHTSRDADRFRQVFSMFQRFSHTGDVLGRPKHEGGNATATPIGITNESFYKIFAVLDMYVTKEQADEIFKIYNAKQDGLLTAYEFMACAYVDDYPETERSFLGLSGYDERMQARLQKQKAKVRPSTPNDQVYEYSLATIKEEIHKKVMNHSRIEISERSVRRKLFAMFGEVDVAAGSRVSGGSRVAGVTTAAGLSRVLMKLNFTLGASHRARLVQGFSSPPQEEGGETLFDFVKFIDALFPMSLEEQQERKEWQARQQAEADAVRSKKASEQQSRDSQREERDVVTCLYNQGFLTFPSDVTALLEENRQATLLLQQQQQEHREQQEQYRQQQQHRRQLEQQQQQLAAELQASGKSPVPPLALLGSSKSASRKSSAGSRSSSRPSPARKGQRGHHAMPRRTGAATSRSYRHFSNKKAPTVPVPKPRIVLAPVLSTRQRRIISRSNHMIESAARKVHRRPAEGGESSAGGPSKVHTPASQWLPALTGSPRPPHSSARRASRVSTGSRSARSKVSPSRTGGRQTMRNGFRPSYPLC